LIRGDSDEFWQIIKIKNDIDKVNGSPYCLILKEDEFVKNYTIKSFDNKAFIFPKNNI
jgi:hypothetical protein